MIHYVPKFPEHLSDLRRLIEGGWRNCALDHAGRVPVGYGFAQTAATTLLHGLGGQGHTGQTGH